jgi:hypothetical protein
MKKVMILCAVLGVAACGEKKAPTPAADTTATMMKSDTGTMMKKDSAMGMQHADSTMPRDTSKKM